jgi:pseudouridine-5'-phosphate glycosidase
MEIEKYLDIKDEVKEALDEGRPVVALESTILSHGMPYPENLDFAAKVEEVIREEGCIPATAALIGGKIKLGLTADELEIMCKAENVGKVSRRDFATYLATGRTGATTVASTMMCAYFAGIKVFATGGIGGVHRNGENTMDISADLQELGNTRVAVVCAGAKQILDIGRTLEYLETMGVPVIGMGTDEFPAFFCRNSGFGVDYRADTPKDAAKVIKTTWDLGLKGGLLIGNPVPEE